MAANDIAFHKSFLKIQMKKFWGAFKALQVQAFGSNISKLAYSGISFSFDLELI